MSASLAINISAKTVCFVDQSLCENKKKHGSVQRLMHAVRFSCIILWYKLMHGRICWFVFLDSLKTALESWLCPATHIQLHLSECIIIAVKHHCTCVDYVKHLKKNLNIGGKILTDVALGCIIVLCIYRLN